MAAYKKIKGDFTGPETFEVFNTQKGLIKIDPYNNRVTYYKENPIYFNVAINQNLPLFKYNGFYYYYNSNNQDLVLTKVTENEFIPKETSSGVLFVNNRNSYYLHGYIYTVVIFFGACLVAVEKKKKEEKDPLCF